MIMTRLIVVLLITVSHMQAGIVSGTVRDKDTQKVLPNVNINVLESDFGAVSDPYGEYKLELEEGTFQLEFSMIGFKPVVENINIQNKSVKKDIYLESIILELEEVEVQGIFSTRLGNESVDVIKGKYIKDLQKNSVSDVLRTLPGLDVQFAQPNGRNVNVSIRGSSDYKPGGYNNRVLVLLDGFPIQIPNSGTPDWSSLPLENIARIEIDNSPTSAQYGHNSMGGVINLITNKSNSGVIKLSGGTYNTGQLSFNYGKNTGSLSIGFTGLARQSAGHRFNSDDQVTRLNTYLHYADKKGRSYKLNLLSAISMNGHPGFDVSPSYRRSDRTSSYIQLHMFYPLSKGMSMSHSIYLNKFDTQYYDRDDTPDDKADAERNYKDMSAGLRSEMLLTKWARWIIMAGSDFGFDQSKVSVFNPIYDDPQQFTFGGFIQSKYSIGNGWSMGSGLRYDYRLVDPGNKYIKRVFEHVTPKVNLMYTLKGKRAFTLAYSTGFRAPSVSELYLQHASSYGLTMQGNPNVRPESVSAIELKYEHPHSKELTWSGAIFHNSYTDMIDFVYSLPVIAVNREGVTGTGSELQCIWSPLPALTIRSEYSYLNMTDKGGDPILYRSKHKASVNVAFEVGSYKMSTFIHGWSAQKYENFLSHEYETVDDKILFPIEELPDQVLVDLNVNKKFKLFDANLSISNVLDMEYELIQDFPMPGRAWRLTLTKTLK